MVATRHQKLLLKILQGRSDANISFSDLCGLMKKLEFRQRIRGDHHIFFKEGVDEILNLQPIGSKAKAYQVRQVRNLILRYKLNMKEEKS